MEATLTGVERRDVLSAFRVLAARRGLDLAAVPATAPAVRRMFETAGPAALGMSVRRHANLRSLVGRAVKRFGMRQAPVIRHAALAPAWTALLAGAAAVPGYHGSLQRLARYCSARDIAPEAVCAETLGGFLVALEAESLTKDPRAVIITTITRWNGYRRSVPGWPPVTLASPWKTEPDAYPLAHFPASFQADVAAWVTYMSQPDPLDPDAPVRALRPATVDGYVTTFRSFASGLLRRGLARREEITGLASFFEGSRFTEGLRHFLRPGTAEAPATRIAYRTAYKLMLVARTYLRLAPEVLAAIDRIRRRLDPKLPDVMGARNRDRLPQFDDPANVARLLGFPQAHEARALRLAHPHQRAAGVEAALAVALLIDASLRLKNLRHIRFASDLRTVRGKVHLSVAASEVKNRQALVFELPDETAALLERFLRKHRPLLPGAAGPWLFPGRRGDGPMSDTGMRDKIARPLKKHCGLVMSPHLFRHVIARMIVEADPSMHVAVSRHLGHTKLATTQRYYLGSETAAASRKLGEILRTVRDTLGGTAA